MLNKLLAFLAFFYIVAVRSAAECQKKNCGHSDIKRKGEFVKGHEINKISVFEKFHRSRRLQQLRPINIRFDIDNSSRADPFFPIVNAAMEIARHFFAERLQVLHEPNRKIKAFLKQCYEFDVPLHYIEEGFDEDLVILFKVLRNHSLPYRAASGDCDHHEITGRPIVGLVEFNAIVLSSHESNFEELVDTAIHETLHVLGISSDLFPLYRDSLYNHTKVGIEKVLKNGTFRGMQVTYVVTKNVVEAARAHFGCDKIIGVPLENDGVEGSAGSHWEAMAVYNDIITAQAISPNSVVTDISLAALQDSGWYLVNRSRAEPFLYGRGGGCAFWDSKCYGGEFEGSMCKESYFSKICGFSGKFIAECSFGGFTNDNCRALSDISSLNCAFPNHEDTIFNLEKSNNFGEVYGRESKCVMNTLNKNGAQNEEGIKAGCYKTVCENGGLTIHLEDGHSVFCQRKDQRVYTKSTNYTGYLICPNIDIYCEDHEPTCEKLCSKRGFCYDGKCECIPGYQGSDCSIPI